MTKGYSYTPYIKPSDRARAGNKNGCGQRHDVDGVRMNEPQIALFLKKSQGFVNTELKKELAQYFVNRHRIGTETAGEFLKRVGKVKG
ncbi:MAG: hypothetical protein GWP06_02805 [Actinobacteria bacterium]|nr:hypothetical protein [Actinomycetota bacterium]